MYLGLIQVVNAHLEHPCPAEHAHGASQPGNLLPQMMRWLGRVVGGGSARADLEKGPAGRT